MEVRLRPFTLEDADICGTICYEAFKEVDEAHGFPSSFESPEWTARALSSRASQGFYSIVAEMDGRIVGSNFLDERGAIGGIGPVSVDVSVQNGSIGRQMMLDVLDRAQEKGLAGVRLTQSAYHNRSLSLYAKLGFDVREPLAVMSGPPLGRRLAGYLVRKAVPADIGACSRVCTAVHGHDRAAELSVSVQRGTATVVEHEGRVTGYATLMGAGGHAVAEGNEDLEALIASPSEFAGEGFLVPTRNAGLFRWCLENGMRVHRPMTLMSLGLYNAPAGAFMPSFLY